MYDRNFLSFKGESSVPIFQLSLLLQTALHRLDSSGPDVDIMKLYVLLRLRNQSLGRPCSFNFFFLHILIYGLMIQVMAQSTNFTLGQPGDPLTPEELNATWTHLTGFEGCDALEQFAINKAFWDAARVLNIDSVKLHINWNSPSAVEFLASPFSLTHARVIQGS